MFENVEDIGKLALIAVGAILVGTQWSKISGKIEDNKTDAAYSDAAISESPSEFAKLFNRAFENCSYMVCAGTDEESVEALVDRIPSKKFTGLMEKEYFNLYNGESFQQRLFDEFGGWGSTSSDNEIYDRLILKLNQKPNA